LEQHVYLLEELLFIGKGMNGNFRHSPYTVGERCPSFPIYSRKVRINEDGDSNMFLLYTKLRKHNITSYYVFENEDHYRSHELSHIFCIKIMLQCMSPHFVYKRIGYLKNSVAYF
jgi:hypothetical protein